MIFCLLYNINYNTIIILITVQPDIPKRTGKINNVDKFDAKYFDIPFIEAHQMDPQSRIVLEHTYEAIIDAGLNPNDLRGTKTGVFVGVCYCETEEDIFYKLAEVLK